MQLRATNIQKEKKNNKNQTNMVSDVDSANKFGDGVGDLDAVVGVEEKVEGEVVFDSVD